MNNLTVEEWIAANRPADYLDNLTEAEIEIKCEEISTDYYNYQKSLGY